MTDLAAPGSDQPPVASFDGPPTGDDRLELLDTLDHAEDLPPRRRSTNRLTWVLVGVLVLGGVFVGGAWFQRTFGPAPTTPSGAGAGGGAAALAAAAAARNAGGFAAGAGGALPAGITVPTTATPAAPAAAGATGSGETRGTVKLVDGTKVYVATADGTIVIVTTKAETAVQVAAPGAIADLKAGQTVTVQGTVQADGTVAATEIVGRPAGR